MGYPANPNPSRITEPVWKFRCDMLALEPGSDDEDSGIYANKPGYHNTRAQNSSGDYSVRDAADQKGPSDKAAAWDWTFRSAQNGDYSRISIYGKRFKAAFDARDPRCNVLREFLGQTDTDTTPEGLDFRYHSTRTPDSSHEWHDHFSFVRAYVAVVGALDAVLSVAKGETLDAYRARGGKLYKIDGTGEIMDYSEAQMRAFPWQYDGNGIGENGDTVHRSTLSYFDEMLDTGRRVETLLKGLDTKFDELLAALAAGGVVAGPMSVSLSGSISAVPGTVSMSGTATPMPPRS
jgi:hypothetical protein